MLRCRSFTATCAFLQCRRHFDQKLRCSKRKTALQHCKSCISAGKWRFLMPLSSADFKLPRSGPADCRSQLLNVSFLEWGLVSFQGGLCCPLTLGKPDPVSSPVSATPSSLAKQPVHQPVTWCEEHFSHQTFSPGPPAEMCGGFFV